MLVQLVLLPGLVVGWQAFHPVGSWAAWFLEAVVVGAVLLVMDRLLDWSFLSVWERYLVRFLFFIALLYSGIQTWGRPLWAWPEGWAWLWPAGALLLLLGSALLLAQIRQGRQIPGKPLPLSFPLRDGCYHVAHGGSTKLINGHLKVTAPALRQWRGQMWGLDIVKLYAAGNRARGFIPKRLDRYAIFGERVYAPCAGEVVAVEGGLPDLIPPASDPDNKAGNYVLLRSHEGGVVLLAHLRQGSIVVEPGQQVAVGDRLGEVGNSGNTSEPHLHISAQQGVGAETILDAEPRPVTFDGAWLLRNDRFCREGAVFGDAATEVPGASWLG